MSTSSAAAKRAAYVRPADPPVPKATASEERREQGRYWGCVSATKEDLKHFPPTAKLIYAKVSSLRGGCSSFDGRTAVSKAKLAELTGRSLRSVQRAWRWLVKAGFVRILGGGRKRGPEGVGWRSWAVWLVIGKAFGIGVGFKTKIPMRGKEELKRMPDSKRGGARAEAGRKPRDLGMSPEKLLALVDDFGGNVKEVALHLGVPQRTLTRRVAALLRPESNSRPESNETVAQNAPEEAAAGIEDGAAGIEDGAPGGSSGPGSPRDDSGKVAAGINCSSGYSSDLLSSSFRRSTEDAPEAPSGSFSEEEKPDRTDPAPASSADALRDLPAGTVSFLGAKRGPLGARPPAPKNLGSFQIPAFPGFDLIPVATVPAPPRLDPDLDEWERVEALREAYRSAAGAIYDRRIFLPATSPGSRLWEQLVQAADLIVEERIPPLPWVAWSIQRMWSQLPGANKPGPKGGKPKPCPISFVFQPARIQKRAGWFGHEMGDYGGGKILMTEIHRQLIKRWLDADAAVRVSRTRDAAAAAVWARFFPGDLYSRWVERARVESERDRRKLAEALEDGKFLWL